MDLQEESQHQPKLHRQPRRQRRAGRGRWLIGRIVAAIVIVAATTTIGPLTTPASAHSSLIGASPAPDATAGGAITIVELAFNEPVSNAEISVSFNEEPLAGVTTLTEGLTIRFELSEGIEVPGRYEIRYDLISFDTDHTTNAFFFTYALDAPPPADINSPEAQGLIVGSDAEGRNWPLIAAGTVFFISLIGLLGLFVWQLDAKRQRESMT